MLLYITNKISAQFWRQRVSAFDCFVTCLIWTLLNVLWTYCGPRQNNTHQLTPLSKKPESSPPKQPEYREQATTTTMQMVENMSYPCQLWMKNVKWQGMMTMIVMIRGGRRWVMRGVSVTPRVGVHIWVSVITIIGWRGGPVGGSCIAYSSREWLNRPGRILSSVSIKNKK